MKKEKITHEKSKALPYLLLSAVVGITTGILIFLFKISSSYVMKLSGEIYSAVRENPIYLPLLLIGAMVIGLISAMILKYAKECRGGGIPTAIASIRGLLPLKWLQGIFVLFCSALLTFFVGVPLGNEGPSVQMGTAAGKGVSRLAGKNRRAWERYAMTAGASSGFAIATGAPLSGIVFALEEAHRRFSPAIFTVAAISVITGTLTQEHLSRFFGVDTTFFDLTIDNVLPFKNLWVAIVIGIITGIVSIFFTAIYKKVRKFDKKALAKVPFPIKITVIFVISALFGFWNSDFIGTGHHLIEEILHGEVLIPLLIAALIIRPILMIFANGEGVCGGLFVPTLTFGAIIAALITETFVALGAVDAQYFPILVAVGMASFFSASSRTPITALTFGAEALCVSHNILPLAIGVAISYFTVEFFGKSSFTDAVIESKIEHAHKGQLATVVDKHMTVMDGAFAAGMNNCDILWPPTCAVLSVDKAKSKALTDLSVISEGDVLHIHYQTYDDTDTTEILTNILGDQPEDEKAKRHVVERDHIIPLD